MLKADFLDRALPWTSLILHNRQFINELNVSPANRLCVALIFALVVALMLTLLWPGAWMAAGTITILLLIISSPLYLFFVRKKGLLFTLAVIPWHWLYYFYSGLAFTIGSLRHLANRRKMHS